VEIDHHPAPGCLMQSVYVLGEQHLALAVGLELSQGVMSVVGTRSSKAAPADHAARPIASARASSATNA